MNIDKQPTDNKDKSNLNKKTDITQTERVINSKPANTSSKSMVSHVNDFKTSVNLDVTSSRLITSTNKNIPTLSELRTLPHLSASSINSYIECGLQYKLAKIDHIKPEFTADVLVFGTAIHRVLEAYHEARMYDEYLPLSVLLSTFEMFWQDELSRAENIRFKKGADATSLLNTGKSLLTTYYDKYPDDGYRVIATEEPFTLSVTGVPEAIIGALDLLEEDDDGTIIITDHKTAGRAFSIDEVEKNMQLTIYYLAMKQKYPDREIILKLDTLIKTKKPRFEQFYTYRSEIDQIRTIRKIKAVWQGIENGTFIPNDTSWKCPGCAYKNHCNEWFEQQEEAV